MLSTWDCMISYKTKSMPFRQPVNPQKLGIPTYFDIIKKPMDLKTIKTKLIKGQYLDPWKYIDDVWLMFENACCTNASIHHTSFIEHNTFFRTLKNS